MTAELNHTIIPAKDKCRSAKFLADILGLEAGPEWAHFGNGVTLDFADAAESAVDTTPFSSARLNSTPRYRASKARASPSGPTSTAKGAARSTISMAAAASISRIPTAISWKSSRAPTDPRPRGGPTRRPDNRSSRRRPIS
jgi:hypothetical protein